MAAVHVFALPDLGEGLTSAEIVHWLVEVGDVIEVDQPVAEVETAKAVVEVPCPHAGVVTSLAGPAGTELQVGRPLITVAAGSAGEPSDGPAGGPARGSEDEAGGSGSVLVGYGTREQPARTGRRARTGLAPQPAPASRSAPAPQPVTEPATRLVDGVVRVVSPLVRRLARDNGVDLRSLAGSGPDGLIRRRDVEAAVMTARTASAAGADDHDVVPLSPLGRHAAEAFTRSRREVADSTCWVDADATALLATRATLNQSAPAAGAPGADSADSGGSIGLLAIVARVCVAALLRFPDLNSQVVTDLDGRATAVRRHRAVHLGFAAQTPRGLVVPVVRDAQALTTAALAGEITRLTTAARAGSLTPAELSGGTFTLNNYGVFGVDGATPIIHHPETSMIGIGRIIPRPWAVNGTLAVRSVAQLSFTFDHRVCDGATAGAFLRFVADAVENPTRLLRYL